MIQSKFKYILANAFKICSSPYVRQIGQQQCNLYAHQHTDLIKILVESSQAIKQYPGSDAIKEKKDCKVQRIRIEESPDQRDSVCLIVAGYCINSCVARS